MSRVVLPGALRQYSDGASSIDFPASEGTTLADVLDVLDAMEARCPRLSRRVRDEQGQLRRYVNVYLDGTDVRELGGITATVAPDAEILVLPSVAGG
ncbi:MAG: MoaD/ThiS family protein [Actinomycetota bacterium]|nr:MoaD/ThiS family protein [Actinomycetota bacterium]